MTRAAWYGRVSTADQVDNTSLAEQKSICEATIAAKGWDQVAAYVDEGRSGTDSNRPQWRALLDDAKSGKIDAVVVAKFDRFARKAADAITETDRLTALGVDIVVVKDNLDMSTPAGRAMRTMLAGFAELERDTIVLRTVSGQRAKARNGEWPGGKPPFGWRLEGHKRTAAPVPDARERAVLDRAYELLVKRRMTPGEVAARLNDEGLHPRLLRQDIEAGKVRLWDHDSVRRTLANDTNHTGVVVWGARESGTMYKRGHRTRLDAKGNPMYGDPIEMSLPDPPFTSRQFDAVIRAFKARSTRGTYAPAETKMLSTRVYGACGKAYIGVSLKNKDYDVYRCSGRKHRRGPEKCECKQMQVQALDARVWSAVSEFLGDPERLEAMARKWLEVPEDSDDLSEAQAGIDKRIEQLERAERNAARELLLSDSPDAIREALAEVKAELTDLRARKDAYAHLQATVEDRARRLRDVAALARRAQSRLHSMPAQDRRQIVELLDIKVVVHGEVVGSQPQSLSISGQIDPRLFDDGGNAEGVIELGPSPDSSGDESSNHEQGNHRDERVLDGRHALVVAPPRGRRGRS